MSFIKEIPSALKVTMNADTAQPRTDLGNQVFQPSFKMKFKHMAYQEP